MKRNTVHVVVDSGILLVFVALMATGLLIEFVLPPGAGGGRGGGRAALGLGRHDWGEVHFWLALGVIALSALHVGLHWAWVCGTVRRLLTGRSAGAGEAKRQALYGASLVGVVVLVVGGFLFAGWRTLSPAREGERGGFGRGLGGERSWNLAGAGSISEETGLEAGPSVDREGRRSARDDAGYHARGSTTVGEAAEAAGMSVEAFCEELGLPRGTQRGARLGRLRQQHDFEMADVRAIVARGRERGGP